MNVQLQKRERGLSESGTMSEDWRTRAVEFVLNMRNPDGLFRMSPSCAPSFLGTCFGVYLLHGLRILDSTAIQIEPRRYVDSLRKHRSTDGTFWDSSFPAGGTATHDAEYLRLQFTSLALGALRCLGATEETYVEYAEMFCTRRTLADWLQKLHWRDAWKEGNRLLFLSSILLHNAEVGPKRGSRNALHEILDHLRATQDPSTGFWGTDRGASLPNAVAGAYHLYLIFDYSGRRFAHEERIINNTLAIQNREDGLFAARAGGGACEDLDAVDILTRCSATNDFRREEISRALEKTAGALRALQNADGGFPYSKRSAVGSDLIHYFAGAIMKRMTTAERLARLRTFPQVVITRSLPLQFSGDPTSIVPPHESDLFSTWFRLTALAVCASYNDSSMWRSGGGWWSFPPFLGTGWNSLQ